MDKYPLIRKCVAVGIILLFAGTGIVPTIAQDGKNPSLLTSSGSWLYVGGDGPGNYTTVQDAIDNASDGNTVFVYNGMYNECIQINKSISLIGQDKSTTIINGSGYYRAIWIIAKEISLSGFTIQNDGLPWTVRFGIDVIPPSSDIEIHDNIITKNYYGIACYYYGIVIGSFSDTSQQRNISIYENIIRENTFGIGEFGDDSIIQIYHNTISQNEYGIKARPNYTISENIITNNSIGISEGAGEVNVIYHNDFRDNDVGLSVLNFLGSEISKNNFINNHHHTSVSRSGLLLEAPFQVVLKQKWSGNYFDDWIKTTPRPILGLWSIYIWFWISWS